MERVYPSAAGAHQIVTVRCPGIRKGCGGSAALVDGTLFYVGVNGVYAFDGSMPSCVSQPLGSVRYAGAAAAGWNGQYWLAARDEAGGRHAAGVRHGATACGTGRTTRTSWPSPCAAGRCTA